MAQIFKQMNRYVSNHRKRVIVGAIVAVVLLGAGGYTLWSKASWDGYELQYTSWHVRTRQGVTHAFAMSAKSEQERERKLISLKDISTSTLSDEKTLCRVNSLIEWQQVINAFAERIKACHVLSASRVAFVSKLQPITMYLENEQALAKILAKVPSGQTELAEGDWNGQVTAWQGAREIISQLSVSKDFDAVKQGALTQVTSIEAAWKEVTAASMAKDKARHIKAQSQLVKAYGALPQVAATSSTGLQKLIDQLPTLLDNA